MARFACSATSPGAEDGAVVVGSGYRAEKGHLPLSSESHFILLLARFERAIQVHLSGTVQDAGARGLAGAFAAIACGQSRGGCWLRQNQTLFGPRVRLPSLALRLKLFVKSRPVEIALIRDNLISL